MTTLLSRLPRVGLWIGGAVLVSGTAIYAALSTAPSAHSQMPPAPAATPSYAILARPATQTDDVTKWRITPRQLADEAPELALDPDGTRIVRTDAERVLAVIPRKDA